jgi:hypothetical protein
MQVRLLSLQTALLQSSLIDAHVIVAPPIHWPSWQ